MAQVIESNGDGRPTPVSGVYQHPETGEELICVQTSKFGNPQADAAQRLGFVWVRDIDSKVNVPDDPTAPPKVVDSTSETDALRRQVEQLQQENAELASKAKPATKAKTASKAKEGDK